MCKTKSIIPNEKKSTTYISNYTKCKRTKVINHNTKCKIMVKMEGGVYYID